MMRPRLKTHISPMVSSLLSGLLVISASGCAEISTKTRPEFVDAGVERRTLEPDYKTRVDTSLEGGADFRSARLMVTATRAKQCRTQVLEVRKQVVYTTHEVANSAIIWVNALIGGVSLGCGAAQFSDSPCVSSTEDSQTGESQTLSAGARRGIGVGLGVLGTAAASAVIADLVRSIDEQEVVDTERRPTHTETQVCGTKPYADATVKIYPPDSDAASLTTRTNAAGRAEVALSDLSLAKLHPGTSVGRVVVEETSAKADALPSRWAASKKAYYARKLLDKARSTDTAQAYLDYLDTRPTEPNATKAHRALQAIVMKRAVPRVLKDYLRTYRTAAPVRQHRQRLTGRLHALQLDKAFGAYVDAWHANGQRRPEPVATPTLEDDRAAEQLAERLYGFHRDQIRQAKSAGHDFDVLRANYRAAVEVAPTDADKRETRNQLASLVLAQAAQLDGQPDVGPKAVLSLYEQAAAVAASETLTTRALSGGLSAALQAFDATMSATPSPPGQSSKADKTRAKPNFLLHQATKFARSDAGKKKVRQAQKRYDDHRAKHLVEQAKSRADSAKDPANPAVLRDFEHAIDMAATANVNTDIRGQYLRYLGQVLAIQATRVSESENTTLDQSLVKRGLAVAKSEREADIVRLAWIDACAKLAGVAAGQDQLDQIRAWIDWMEAANIHDDSPAAKKELDHRRTQIERKLHKRFPPSKLDSLRQAAIIYRPTISPKDHAATRAALAAPQHNRGERLVVALEVQRKVGNKYLAETDRGQQVFIYSSNQLARTRLDTGRRLGVLATIDGTIPYRKRGNRIELARLDIIWAAQ